jgi:hypothetical protein
LNEKEDPDKWQKCSVCDNKKARYRYTVQFIDYRQFKDFFELTKQEDESMPFQLKTYLNQIQTRYHGNSILDDVDPLAFIDNPWWVEDPEERSVVWGRRDTSPVLFLQFGLCGFCKKKAERGEI